jgi:hypothetical protein
MALKVVASDGKISNYGETMARIPQCFVHLPCTLIVVREKDPKEGTVNMTDQNQYCLTYKKSSDIDDRSRVVAITLPLIVTVAILANFPRH